jgi:hypothetical protein
MLVRHLSRKPFCAQSRKKFEGPEKGFNDKIKNRIEKKFKELEKGFNYKIKNRFENTFNNKFEKGHYHATP